MILPDPNKLFVGYWDVSMMSLDSVSMQDGKVIAYALRQLRIHKRIYTIQELELAAVSFGLKIGKYYLYGFGFEVFGNHKSVEYLFGRKE